MASIAAAVGAVVWWGVVYQIEYADRGALDDCEGFNPQRDRARNAYESIEIVVFIQGKLAHRLNVFTQPQPNFMPRGRAPNIET